MGALTVAAATMVRPGAQHLSRYQRVLVHACGWLLLASGLVWLGFHYLIGAGAGELPHPIEAWTMRAHGLAAWVGAFALGSLAAGHVPRGWHTTRHRRGHGQRRLGIALCALGALLVLSGYALMYLIGESWRPAWGWAHALVGVAMAAVLLAHGSGALHHHRGNP